MSGPANNGGGAGGGTVTPTPSGPIGGHLNRLIGSIQPPRAGGKKAAGRPATKKPTTSKASGKSGKPGKRRGGK